MDAEDLIGAVFPDQLACAENIVGEREIPDHPLVRQTIADCLTEAMDIAGLEQLLTAHRNGRNQSCRARSDRAFAAGARSAFGAALRISRRCTAGRAPRPGCHGTALAGAGDRRRSRPARSRSHCPRSRARPGPMRRMPTNCMTLWCGSAIFTEDEARRRTGLDRFLADARARETRRAHMRAASGTYGSRPSACRSLKPYGQRARLEPAITAPAAHAGQEWPPENALIEIVRGRLEGQGPATADALAAPLGLEVWPDPRRARALETEGFALAGPFYSGGNDRGMVRPPAAAQESTTIRSNGCAPRSSPSPRGISCAFCSPGSG